MSSEMRECPFCGNGAWVVRVPDTRRFRPQCKKCGADLGEFDREADAVAAWNRRTLLTRTEAGADGAWGTVVESRMLNENGLCALAVRTERGELKMGDKLYTHPQDASGDAERAMKYEELIYAVGNKYPGETRHETALRYIRQAESHVGSEGCVAMQAKEAK